MDNKKHRVIIWIAVVMFASGCTTMAATESEPFPDPFEPVNRPVFGFHLGVDRMLVRPVVQVYDFVTPGPVGKAVDNFTTNLQAPVDIANALLQGKFKAAGSNTGRLLLNSTIGIGGLIDVGTKVGLERQQEDFGQTLAVWGLPSGPYLVIPFRGPMTLRDLVGAFVDSHFDPVLGNGVEFERSAVRDKLLVLSILERRRRVLGFDERAYEALDPYAFWRATYSQRRMFKIYDGNPPEEEWLFEDDSEGPE